MNVPRWVLAVFVVGAGMVLAGVLVALLSSDGATTIVTDDGEPLGFEVVTLRSTAPDGTVGEWCVWLAETAAQRSQGLQEVTDLGAPIGMAFHYDEPVGNTFHMHDTRLALAIAWFGPDGRFVGSVDTVPCAEASRSDCPRYAPGSVYSLAVEVPAGKLADFGLVADSTAELVDVPCRS